MDVRGPALAEGDAVGRYTIQGLLGAGGMGEVYAARDPELMRDIAVKVLRRGVGGGSMKDRGRFLREAQALATLSHPNVVAVYDIGTIGEQVFVAMERVEGNRLDLWLKERPRGWREIRDVFAAAGRGLEAAHATGIIHRDFKPHNVIVGERRVVVLDFGLARRTGEPGVDSNPERSPSLPPSLDLPLTQTGDLLGTPLYMSPEQLEGLPASERSDQWSFCVALYEALYGVLPFTGRSLAGIAEQVSHGAPPPRKGSGVPRRLGTLVARGLRIDAAARYPSMTALLADLERDPGRRARPWLGAAALTAVAVGAVVAVGATRARRVSPCAGASAALAGVWDEARRGTLRDGFTRVGLPFAADAFARTAAILDAYAGSWTTLRTGTCEATLVRGEQSATLMDQKMLCLDRRRAELAALVEALSGDVDRTAVSAAIGAAARLTPVAACADAAALAARVPLPEDPALRAEVLDLDARVAGVAALVDASRLSVARKQSALLERAVASRYAPLRAHAFLAQGKERYLAGDHDAARARVELAIEAAVEGKDDLVAAEAWLTLLHARNVKGKAQEVADLALPVRVAIKRAGDDPRQVVDLEASLATALTSVDRLDEAQAHADKAMAVARGMVGPTRDASLALAEFVYIPLTQKRGDLVAWRKAATEYADTVARAYGPQHQQAGLAEMNLANVDNAEHRYRDVEQRYLRALAIFAASVGPDSYQAASAHLNLGLLAEHQQHAADALSEYQSAAEIWEKMFGEDNADVGEAVFGIATAQRMLGHHAEAHEALDRAMRIAEKTLPANHTRFLNLRGELAELAAAEGRWADSLREAQIGLAEVEARYGPTHVWVLGFLNLVGNAKLELGRADEAVVDLERALVIAGDPHNAASDVADARWALAQALAAAHRDPARARALAEQAGHAFAEAKDARADQVTAWLHGR